MSQLNQLKEYGTKIVADTGDFQSIQQFQPLDATTNPSLILKAVKSQKYDKLIQEAIQEAKKQPESEQLSYALDKLAVLFGREILNVVKGRVSTELDARLSFDTDASVEKARKIIALYKDMGIDKERILIKIASTWEGLQAAKILEKEGIHCNLTLLFSLEQAIVAADVGATLISPFVGRILDWYKAKTGKTSYPGSEDPGVLSVQTIYNYYKKFDIKTVVMGASFRNTDEITELAGIDLLTISPGLLEKLGSNQTKIEKKLSVEQAKKMDIKKVDLNEKSFRWALNENAMATEKLADGIRRFAQDTVVLEEIISKLLKA